MTRLYSKHFPAPSYLTMNSCSIDISDRSIKYGELKEKSFGLSLDRYGKENIPEGVIVLGKVVKEEELVNLLKKIKSKEKINFVRVSLPEEQTYLFSLFIPKIKNQNLREMILFQIEEYIPLKASDCLFDYNIILERGDDFLVEVVAIASSVLESYLSVINKAGLYPLSFESEAQAITRAVIPKGENKSIMVVDFGNVKTGVFIYKNGQVILTTTLSIGGNDLTNMIAKTFSISFEEAEKKKKEYSLNTESEVKDIFPAILNGLSVLRDELNKQIVYWENHTSNDEKNEKISKVILCGGDANLTGLSEYLELSMKIKVENANVWVNVLDIEKIVPNMSFEESLGYATIIGLSLGNYLQENKTILNILPEINKKNIRKEYWVRFSTILFNLIGLFIFISIVLLFPSFFVSSLKEKMVKDNLESFNKENVELMNNDIDKIAVDINSKLKILSKTESPYSIYNEIINDILLNKVDGITLNQILFDREKIDHSIIELRGVAINRDALRNFKTALDNNTKYLEVNLPVSHFLEKKDLNFFISIRLK
jgi:type IV pilus assembly protein PilM